MKNYALSLLPFVNFDPDDMIDRFESFLVSHSIGSTYAADMEGNRFSICFTLENDDERKLDKITQFVDQLPSECNPSIELIQ